MLLAAVIERAVDDRRSAASRGLIDSNARRVPVKWNKTIRAEQVEECEFLHEFFYNGGLELVLDIADLNIPAERIRRGSEQPKPKRKTEQAEREQGEGLWAVFRQAHHGAGDAGYDQPGGIHGEQYP